MILPDTVAQFNCTAIATFINWKINDIPVNILTNSLVSSFKNKQISETHESVGITRKQYQDSVCSQTRGIIKHKQWCLPCNNACIENSNLSPTPVSHQYANVLEVYKECEGGNNEHDYENVHVE